MSIKTETDWPAPPPWPDPTQTKRRNKTGGKLSPEKLSLAEKRLECFRLRLQGQTFSEIGEAVGMNKSNVWRACKAVADEVQQTSTEEASTLLELECARLDALQQKHWRAATESRNPASCNVVLRCIETRAKLRGLFAPTRFESKTEIKPLTTDGTYGIDRLGLSIECRKEILEGMRRAGAKSVDLSTMKPVK